MGIKKKQKGNENEKKIDSQEARHMLPAGGRAGFIKRSALLGGRGRERRLFWEAPFCSLSFPLHREITTVFPEGLASIGG